MADTPVKEMTVRKGGGLILPETEIKPILAGVGFSVPNGVVLPSTEDTWDLRGLRFPVVVKYITSGVAHKEKSGMVALDICSTDRAIAVVREMFNRHGSGYVLIEEQIGHGLDMFFGFIRDDTFGPLAIANLGGAMAEHSEDAFFIPVPFNKPRALSMFQRSRLYRILEHHCDINDIIELLWRCGNIFLDHEDWDAMDINPVRITPNGIYALDAKAYLKKGGDAT